MKKRISLYVRSVLTFLRIVITKIFNIKGFHSAFIQDFSITTKISVTERGKILLKKHIHTKRNVILCAEGGTLEIGEGCFFNNGCMAVAKERITIGNRAAFGPNVLIYDHDHDISSAESIHDSGYKTSPVVIGDDVWIGANVTILKGVTVGRGAVIAAGAVVTRSIPPYCVSGGIPAHVLNIRFTIEQVKQHEGILYSEKDRMKDGQLQHLASFATK